jgi:hypothetical protein
VQDQGSGRPPGAVIIRARNTGTVIVFGLITLLWVLCLVVSVGAQPTVSGRITAGVVFGLLIVLSVGGLYGVSRGWRQLEVGRDAIVSRPGAKGKSFTLTGDQGDTLRVLPQFKLYARIRHPRLLFLGRGGFLLLSGFQLEKVRRVCEAQGWRFDGDPALAVKDVQSWLNRGESVEAVQLLELFGPFPDAPSTGEPQTALAAAVYEDVGDNLIGSSRSNARDAYRRAAIAQRAFAACARSQDESAARLAEANRIDAKAQP